MVGVTHPNSLSYKYGVYNKTPSNLDIIHNPKLQEEHNREVVKLADNFVHFCSI
jgi:hypothetical protein